MIFGGLDLLVHCQDLNQISGVQASWGEQIGLFLCHLYIREGHIYLQFEVTGNFCLLHFLCV